LTPAMGAAESLAPWFLLEYIYRVPDGSGYQ
jgi:hypothetical protein